MSAASSGYYPEGLLLLVNWSINLKLVNSYIKFNICNGTDKEDK